MQAMRPEGKLGRRESAPTQPRHFPLSSARSGRQFSVMAVNERASVDWCGVNTPAIQRD